MNWMTRTLVVGVLFVGAAKVEGATVTLNAAADTFIGKNVFGRNTNYNDSPILRANLREDWYPDENYPCYTLLKFDLSSFAGQTIEGDVTLKLEMLGQSGNVWRGVRVGELLNDWDPLTATYNNTNRSANWFAYSAVAPYGVKEWTIPQEIVQSWTDSPSTNFGLILNSDRPEYYEPSIFASLENTGGYAVPHLVFETSSSSVPEPSSLAIFASFGALGLFTARRRRRAG